MRDGFTLIELLVVIAVIAVLAVVVIFVLNPVELLRQSRDSNRVSDLAVVATALGVYSAQGGSALGSSSVIYISIPDQAATSSAGDQCQGLGLVSLPPSYSYHCAASSTFRKTDGTGWIPVSLTSISQLPVDPSNSSSSRLYETYAANGSQYELTSALESQRYRTGGDKDVVTKDGGTLGHVYEKGTRFGLEPLDYGDTGLVGYWNFEEGSSSVAYDYSGANATGSWNGTATGTFGYYSAGRIGSFAGSFDGVSTFVNASGSNPGFTITNAVTMVAWIKLNALGADQKIISKRPSYALTVFSNNIPETEVFIATVSNDTRSAGGGTVLATGTWYQIAGTYDGSLLKTYVNGVLDRQIAASGNLDSTAFSLQLGKTADSAAAYFNGLIDNARVYNRALTAAEIAALYAGGK